jgi:hypothetical protein
MTSVFISYAANDSDWPAEKVRRLGELLEALGVEVMLDQFYEQRMLPPRDPSIVEWQDWMRKCVAEADQVVCLSSARYLEGASRNVKQVWGYGVAFESLRMIQQLYRNKGVNDGRTLVVRREGLTLEGAVPEDLRYDCTQYEWPSKAVRAIEHATRLRRGEFPASATALMDRLLGELPGEPHRTIPEDEPPKWADGHRQDEVTIDRLTEAPTFFAALKRDMASRLAFRPYPWTQADALGFVVGLATADKTLARQVMLAVRRVLLRVPKPIDELTRKGAVALYMSCACRWVNSEMPALPAGKAIRVPQMAGLSTAVLSAVLFGGEISLVGGAAGPMAQHVYEVRTTAGESLSANLLRAIYVALHRGESSAREVARSDSDDPEQLKVLVARIRARIGQIQEVEESSFTLLLDQAEVFDGSAWSGTLGVQPFSLDPDLEADLFILSHHDLDAEIREFWQQVDDSAGA